MAKSPLNIAFVWHMHQPFYKDLISNQYMLPWVRLHATKDYYDMAAYMEKYPEIRSVINVVPSLLVQIEDYVAGTAKDKFLDITAKDPEDLTGEERVFMLKNFFMANPETMIMPYPRYYDLLLKRGRFVTLDEIVKVSHRFSNQELFDLQVWFNLAWFGETYKNGDETIKALFKKGQHFSREDKQDMLKKQIEIMAKIIPLYKAMQERGQAEISVTPFYHPILPLVVDNSIARVASPGIVLPKNKFAHPEDAKAQIEKAVAYYTEKFGLPPEGMWPSEGSVSEDIIPLIAGAGIKWIATDEQILANTLQRQLTAHELFKPYYVRKDGHQLSIVFRDHKLSDDLGFVYSRWDPREAASDIVNKLHGIRQALPDDGKNYLVSIILDGENAWEYYRNNGKDFFEELYMRITNDPGLTTVRLKDYVKQEQEQHALPHLFPGSWINSNFNIWIGHGEDNTSWDYVAAAREELAKAKHAPAEAWEELYIAEGSDWNWWYGDDHGSDNDEDFDQLFRSHIRNIYKFLKKEPPRYLETPIKKMKIIKPTREPVFLIKPILDGEVSNYYEWLSAGLYSVEQMKGAMHQKEVLIRNIFFGFSEDTFYLRLDTILDLSCSENPDMKDMSFDINIVHPFKYRVVLYCKDGHKKMNILRLDDSGNYHYIKDLSGFAVKKVIEIGIPFSEIKVKPGDEVHFNIAVKKGGNELESWPKGGIIVFKAPDEDFITSSWFV